MMNEKPVYVYRIYDPVAQCFQASGQGSRYNRGRTVWFGYGAACSALKYMPNKERLVIKRYRLVEDANDI